MHEQQDMVKAFKSKMLLADVLYEQDAQRALKARKAVHEKEIEKHWQEIDVEKMKEYDEKMRAKLEEEYKVKMNNSKAISDQLEDFKLRYIKKIKEEMLEGELIKRQAEEDLEREKMKELQRLKKVA
jgi:predicted RNase H-like nuclease